MWACGEGAELCRGPLAAPRPWGSTGFSFTASQAAVGAPHPPRLLQAGPWEWGEDEARPQPPGRWGWGVASGTCAEGAWPRSARLHADGGSI